LIGWLADKVAGSLKTNRMVIPFDGGLRPGGSISCCFQISIERRNCRR
jgi:hypothetical protein